LWAGAIIMSLGVCMSMFRRRREKKKFDQALS